MSTNKTNPIDEVIRMQAIAVKNQTNNEKAAELLMKAAELLKGEPQPKVDILKELTTAKAENVAKYGAAFTRLRDEEKKKMANDIHQSLTSMGWKSVLGDLAGKGYATYNNNSFPGEGISILGDDYKITSNGELKQRGKLTNLLQAVTYHR